MNETTKFRAIPKQRLLKSREAARYLGVHPQTLRKITEEGHLKPRSFRNRKAYLVEELDEFIASLPESD